MKVQLRLSFPILNAQADASKNAGFFDAHISRTWIRKDHSPFDTTGIPHTGDYFSELKLKLVVNNLKERSVAYNWKISGEFKSSTDCSAEQINLQVIPESLCISNSMAGIGVVPIMTRGNNDILGRFISHLLQAGWVDEGNNFEEFKPREKSDESTSP